MAPKNKEENNNNESYLSSVGDSVDSASNIAEPPLINNACVNSARKSLGPPEDQAYDRKGAIQSMLIESAVAPTLDHEFKGAYQL